MKGVKGKTQAITGLAIYLDYVIRFEIDRLLQTGEIPNGDVIAAAVAQHVTDDYKVHAKSIMGDIGKKLKERVK